MKAFLFVPLIIAWLASTANAQEKPTPKPDKPLVVEPVKATAAKPGLVREVFSMRLARRLGFTSGGVRSAFKELEDSGEIVKGETSRPEAAVAIFDHVRARNPEGSGIEIPDELRDLIIAFIEALLKSLILI